jgi:diguanylate cyclase (GGDEF)-like protein
MAEPQIPTDHAEPGWPIPDDEQKRLQALYDLDALDRSPSGDLDGLTRVAAYICGTPTAVVNLIDAERQWSAAAFGYQPHEVSRADSMCATSIMSRDVSYTADARVDPRWSQNPFVTGEVGRVRLYASAPLIVDGGEVVGTLCAFDEQRRELTRVQIERLRDLAAVAVRVLELRESESRLMRAATRDRLTGLPNRALFEESARMALARNARGERASAVIFMDLDRFKQVNDDLGHAAGDALLCEVAERLLASVRATDLVARLAGDELVILCDVSDDHTGAERLVHRLRVALAEPFALAGTMVTVGASFGIAYAERGDTCADLLARADAAMYADKRSGPH